MSRTTSLAPLLVALLVAPLAARADDAAAAAGAAASNAAAPGPGSSSAADRAAAAAERAAAAAEKAADAAARSAAAVEKLSNAAPGAAVVGAPGKPAEAVVVAPAKGADPVVVAVVAVVPPPPPHWTGTLGLGLISLTGNSQSLTFKASAAFERKGPEWITSFKANAVYGQQRVTATTVAADGTTTISEADSVSALGADAQLRGDRRITDQLSIYAIGGILTDHITSIEERPIAELGVSLIWFDVKEPVAKSDKPLDKTSLRTDLGFRYGHEYRYQYYPTPMALPGVDIIAPHGGLAFRYAINKDIIFTHDMDVTGNLVGDARLLFTTLDKLSSRLTGEVALAVSFGTSYDSAPAAGRRTTDTALTVGLEVGL